MGVTSSTLNLKNESKTMKKRKRKLNSRAQSLLPTESRSSIAPRLSEKENPPSISASQPSTSASQLSTSVSKPSTSASQPASNTRKKTAPTSTIQGSIGSSIEPAEAKQTRVGRRVKMPDRYLH